MKGRNWIRYTWIWWLGLNVWIIAHIILNVCLRVPCSNRSLWNFLVEVGLLVDIIRDFVIRLYGFKNSFSIGGVILWRFELCAINVIHWFGSIRRKWWNFICLSFIVRVCVIFPIWLIWKNMIMIITILEIKISLLLMSNRITHLAPCLNPKKMHFLPLWSSLVLWERNVDGTKDFQNM